MVGEKYRKVDGLAVIPAELVNEGLNVIPGAIIYRSGDRYAFSPVDIRDDTVMERVGAILRGMPSRTDGNLKQVLEIADKKIAGGYIDKRGVELEFVDETGMLVDGRSGLPAALSEGAELYVEDEAMRPLRKMNEHLQDKISALLERKAFHDLPSHEEGIEVAPPELDDTQYAPMRFLMATTGIETRARDGSEKAESRPAAIKTAIPRGVSIEVELGGGDVYLIGHTTDSLGEEQYGSGDDLLRAAYVLGDGDTEIKTRFIGQAKAPSAMADRPSAKARATVMYLEDQSASGKMYAVKLQSKPIATHRSGRGQAGTDIMERTLVAEAQGEESDIYKRFGEMGPIADTASLEAKLLLDKGAKVRAIYLDLVEVGES